MKKKLLYLITFLLGICVVIVYQAYFDYSFLSGSGSPTLASGETLVGSSTSLARLTSSTAFSDSVSAVGSLTGAVDQLVETNRLENVILNIMARGGTVTSTLFIRQMGSQDGTNYFDIYNTTSTINSGFVSAGTSTIVYSPRSIQWDAGTATTSLSITFETYGYRFTRFLIWGEDIALDPNDGTFVWITAIKPEPIKY